MVCASCGLDKEESEFASRKDRGKITLRKQCRVCRASVCHQYNVDNADKVKAQKAEYIDKNKEKIKKRKKLYREKNREKINARTREYECRPEIREKRKEYYRKNRSKYYKKRSDMTPERLAEIRLYYKNYNKLNRYKYVLKIKEYQSTEKYKERSRFRSKMYRLKNKIKIEERNKEKAVELQEYRKEYYKEHKIELLEKRKIYYHRTKDENIKKYRAKEKVRIAIQKGVLIKPEFCDICGVEKSGKYLQAHHEDYDDPLYVIWVCYSCHAILNIQRREKEKIVNTVL